MKEAPVIQGDIAGATGEATQVPVGEIPGDPGVQGVQGAEEIRERAGGQAPAQEPPSTTPENQLGDKPTALPPVSYAEKAKIKVPEPIKVEHICDSCDISFKNRIDLKIHFLNEHPPIKEQKSSKKKSNR